MKLSVVIPAYNESENLRDAIDMISAGISAVVSEYEIIIIDDGSQDATGDIIRDLANHNENIRGIFHGENRGKGASLRSGFNVASKDWLLLTDADLQIDISELGAFLDYVKGYDLVIGFRTGRSDHVLRLVFSKIFTFIISVLLGVRIRDINYPFKLLKNSMINTLELHSRQTAVGSRSWRLPPGQGLIWSAI